MIKKIKNLLIIASPLLGMLFAFYLFFSFKEYNDIQNVNSLYEIAYFNNFEYRYIDRMGIVTQMALRNRFKNKKDPFALNILAFKASSDPVDPETSLFNLSKMVVGVDPTNREWQNMYLILKLIKYKALSGQEQNNLVQSITNNDPTVREDIYLYICYKQRYDGTAFLKPYEGKINEVGSSICAFK